jgi:hypothetical protein
VVYPKFPITSFHFAPGIFLSRFILFSNTCNLYSSLKIRYRVSQPYKSWQNVLRVFSLLDLRRLENQAAFATVSEFILPKFIVDEIFFALITR